MGKKLKQNKIDIIDNVRLLPEQKGGTGVSSIGELVNALNVIPKNKRNLPNGVLGLDGFIKIPNHLLPLGLNIDSVNIEGSNTISVDSVTDYTILGYSSFNNYDVQVSSGSIIVNEDIISFTAPSVPETVTLTINNTHFLINVVPITAYINTPAITSPLEDASLLAPNVSFTSDAFGVTGTTDTHEGSDWQLATDAAFSNIVSSVSNDGINKTSWSLSNLLPGTSYYARVRYKGISTGYSNWSNVVNFTTQTAYVNVPSILSPVNNSIDLGPNVTFTGSIFAASGGTDTHEGSDWQLATDAAFSNIVSSVTNSGVDKTNWSVSGLLVDTVYYARVRYKGFIMGYSNWSNISTFTTKSNFIPISEEAKLLANDKAAGDNFGFSISVDSTGQRVAVGAKGKNSAAGAVYVYLRSGSTWSQEAKLIDSNGVANNNFGWSVSINTDGSLIAIGAPYESDANRAGAGIVYVFTRSGTNWSEQASFSSPLSDANANFGTSVSLDSTGIRLAVGEPNGDQSVQTNCGRVYVFSRSGSTWTEEDRILASDYGEGDRFGTCLQLSSNAGSLVIGADSEDPGNLTDAGSVYVFTRSGTTWTEHAKLTASDKIAGDRFGYSVSINGNGDRVAIGVVNEDSTGTTNSGAIYIFTRSGGTWIQEAKLLTNDKVTEDQLGYSVSMNDNGDIVAAGARGVDFNTITQAGAVYIFTRSGTTWTQEAKISASDKQTEDLFGFSVDISGSGNRVVAGAATKNTAGTVAGAAYVFA